MYKMYITQENVVYILYVSRSNAVLCIVAYDLCTCVNYVQVTQDASCSLCFQR